MDVDRRELRSGDDLVSLQPQVFDLLAHLIRNRDRVVSKDDLVASVWSGRAVSDSTLGSRLNAVRRAVGDSGKEQRLIRTFPRRGVRFIGDVNVVSVPNAPPSVPVSTPTLPLSLRQDVRFCRARDGVRIAYAEVGNGAPLVKSANWLHHLEYDWQSPVWRHLLQGLAAKHRLIRYDLRGTGLSDWEAPEISFEAFVHDLEAVVDAAGVERFPLFGISQGCAIAIAYAVRHPERVSHLILYGGFARGLRKRGSAEQTAMADAVAALTLHGWGKESPSFRQMFTTRLVPGAAANAEEMQWFSDLQRVTTSPEMAVRLRHASNDIDVTGILGRVQAPTLVLHCRGDEAVLFDEGRLMAAGIPGSRFIALEGRNHLPLEKDSASARLLEETRLFLRE